MKASFPRILYVVVIRVFLAMFRNPRFFSRFSKNSCKKEAKEIPTCMHLAEWKGPFQKSKGGQVETPIIWLKWVYRLFPVSFTETACTRTYTVEKIEIPLFVVTSSNRAQVRGCYLFNSPRKWIKRFETRPPNNFTCGLEVLCIFEISCTNKKNVVSLGVLSMETILVKEVLK